MIRVLVADDEPLARDELVYLLKQRNDIEIVGEAANGEEALEKTLKLSPDVVFLDIQMPKMDGLTVARELLNRNIPINVVFATAYDQHAIHAFEINAVDYLLKPFDEERVKKTLERLKQRLTQPNTEVISRLLRDMMGKNQVSQPLLSKLAVQTEESLVLLEQDEILYVYRTGRDVHVKTLHKNLKTKYTLQVLEERLSCPPFFRTHRSYLVNLKYAQELVPWFNGAYTLILNDKQQTKIPVSRAYVKELKDLLRV